MSAPLVSVLMPCFNAEPYLRDALESVLSQTYPHVEIVAVNDGSRDATAQILESYKSRGVRVIHQANKGQSAAANRAFSYARGELIKFFDADDLMDPDMVRQQVVSLGSRRDAIAMARWARFYRDPAEARFAHLPMYRDASPVDWLTSEWLTGQPMMQCAMWLIPAEMLHKSGGWDERLSLINDFEFFARVLLAAEEIIYTPDARLYYRSGLAGSLSARKSAAAAQSACLSLILGTQHLLDARDSIETRQSAANMLQTFEYTFFPFHSRLRHQVRDRMRLLGGGRLSPPGPPGFHRLRQFVGWRAARIVQLGAEGLGYNRSARTGQMQ